ncbi:DNA replication and repair protein RecF [Pelagibacteraceae bacterium]|nr:DNA replication and repair protein RecF [Pelagibacteraceae bacterium]
MGKVKNISIKNFRNFQSCDLSFGYNCNILYGDNGSGKTNILECISLIGKGRGFRNANIKNLIYKNEFNFNISSDYEYNSNLYKLNISSLNTHKNYKKILSVNEDTSRETIEFLDSSVSLLYFLPEMERLFLSSPSNRRNFIDKLIFSEKKNYNKLVNKYKKSLIERNKLLQLEEYDKSWIDKIEHDIADFGIEIYNLRARQISIINQNLKLIINFKKYPFEFQISILDPFYSENLNIEIYKKKLVELREIDKMIGGSRVGPHKFDFKANVNNIFDASQLSTGQQKTLVLMLLISQCKYLVNLNKIKPILLFDEICSHLDNINRKILLDLIQEFDLQLFITGTEKSLFSFISTNANFYNITDL